MVMVTGACETLGLMLRGGDDGPALPPPAVQAALSNNIPATADSALDSRLIALPLLVAPTTKPCPTADDLL
jgi:hypothetical protein